MIGIHRFVGAQRQHPADALIDGGINHVLAADDIGLNGLKRVVLTRRHLLERRRMNHDRYPGKSALQTLRVAYISDEVAQAGMIEAGGAHIVLFEFVPAEDDELLGMIFTQHQLDEPLAERSRPARDQHNLFLPIHSRGPFCK